MNAEVHTKTERITVCSFFLFRHQAILSTKPHTTGACSRIGLKNKIYTRNKTRAVCWLYTSWVRLTDPLWEDRELPVHRVHRGYESLGIEGSSANVLRCGGGGHIVRRSRRHAERMVLFTSTHCPLLSPTHFGSGPRTRATGKHTTEFVQQRLAAVKSYVGWPAINLMKRLAWCHGHKCRSWGLFSGTVGDCHCLFYRVHHHVVSLSLQSTAWLL